MLIANSGVIILAGLFALYMIGVGIKRLWGASMNIAAQQELPPDVDLWIAEQHENIDKDPL